MALSAGSVVAKEQGAQGKLPSHVSSAKWSFTVQPVYGWGDSGGKQKSTAGWLAALPVFEPHWQVHSRMNFKTAHPHPCLLRAMQLWLCQHFECQAFCMRKYVHQICLGPLLFVLPI